MKRKTFTKSALAISLLLLSIWAILGATSTMAWFADTDVVVNSFTFGEVNIELYHKDGGIYKTVDATTKLFDDEALYEPGYTQVVYLKVENTGTVPFDYKFSVNPTDYVDGTSVTGQPIHLPNHLKFGVVIGNTEDEVMAATANRTAARAAATTPLNNYTQPQKSDYSLMQTDLGPGGTQYAAIVIAMPEGTGNEANYRGTPVPEVVLGITVLATQIEARS